MILPYRSMETIKGLTPPRVRSKIPRISPRFMIPLASLLTLFGTSLIESSIPSVVLFSLFLLCRSSASVLSVLVPQYPSIVLVIPLFSFSLKPELVAHTERRLCHYQLLCAYHRVESERASERISALSMFRRMWFIE